MGREYGLPAQLLQEKTLLRKSSPALSKPEDVKDQRKTMAIQGAQELDSHLSHAGDNMPRRPRDSEERSKSTSNSSHNRYISLPRGGIMAGIGLGI